MSVDYNGIVSAPVRLEEVRVLIGAETSCRNLSELCKSNNINKWSKYKPIRHYKTTPLDKHMSYSSGYIDEFQICDNTNKAYNPYYGFGNADGSYAGVPKYVSSDLVSSQSGYLLKSKVVSYYKPRGAGSGKNGNDEPYRLTDFDGYYHYAPPPMAFQKEEESEQIDYCPHYNIVDYERVDCINCVAINKLNDIVMTSDNYSEYYIEGYCFQLDDFVGTALLDYSIAYLFMDTSTGEYIIINTAKTLGGISRHPTTIQDGDNFETKTTRRMYNATYDTNRFSDQLDSYYTLFSVSENQRILTFWFDAYYINRAVLKIKGTSTTKSNIQNGFFKSGKSYYSAPVLFPFQSNNTRPAGIYIPTGGYNAKLDVVISGQNVAFTDCYSFAVCNVNEFTLSCDTLNTQQ